MNYSVDSNQTVYLDNGATAFPKPECVYAFMDEFYRKAGVNPGRSGTDQALETANLVLDTRKRLTKFFNGSDPDRLVFGYNATDALNIIIGGMLKEGDHAITTNLEHNSVLRPLYVREQSGMIDVDYIPFDENGYINPEDVKAAIRKNTALVIINHGSNVIGTVQDVAAVGKICKEAGVPFAIDASQTAGMFPIDMKAMNINVVAFTGHKSLMGPTGIGGLCVDDDTVIQITRHGGTGVRSAVRTHLEEYPFRLETGTMNLVGVAGLFAGVGYIEERGLDNIRNHELQLYDRLRAGLKKIPGVTTYCAGPGPDHLPVISFNVEGYDASHVGTILDVDYNVSTRTGLQCAPLVHVGIGTFDMHGTVRFSAGPFNTDSDIDTAIQAVQEIAEMRKK